MTEENSTDNTQVYGPNNAQGNSTDNIKILQSKDWGHLVAEGYSLDQAICKRIYNEILYSNKKVCILF